MNFLQRQVTGNKYEDNPGEMRNRVWVLTDEKLNTTPVIAHKYIAQRSVISE